ncbi:MAG TPA: MOSC domain-containing protein [Longimicrobiaceae bacterium]|nr:MOSC domain-containing protein [Longimicrobiaceae bacterium]
MPKLSVARAYLTREGLLGDRQANRKHHGGPERALCLFSLEVIERLRAEGHPISPGSTGENVTVAGLPWEGLRIGNRLALGDEVVVEISSYTIPCKNIRHSFTRERFKRISPKNHLGETRLYARVLREGWLEEGQAVRLLDAGG